MISSNKEVVILYYDGDCLICKQFSKYVALKKKYNVEIRNAREYEDEIHALQKDGYDINQGMILISSRGIFVWEDASEHLDLLIDRSNWFDSFALSVTHLPWLSRHVYKIGKLIRRVVFFLQGQTGKITFK